MPESRDIVRDHGFASLSQVRHYFGYESLKQFRDDWEALTEKDRADLRVGIGNGTFDYAA